MQSDVIYLFFLYITLIYYYTGTRSTLVVHFLTHIHNFGQEREEKKLLAPLDSIYLIFFDYLIYGYDYYDIITTT